MPIIYSSSKVKQRWFFYNNALLFNSQTTSTKLLLVIHCSTGGSLFHRPVYSELSSCVKVEVAVLASPSLIVLMVSVDVKQHWAWTICLLSDLRSCVKVEVDVQGSPSLIVRTVSVDVKHHWTGLLLFRFSLFYAYSTPHGGHVTNVPSGCKHDQFSQHYLPAKQLRFRGSLTLMPPPDGKALA